ncbi:MAG: prepilin-type N-terminal cleavage/methylation domain-containing protein [Planctomycetes bacterium]|nr:prepilin-type N-terminal cleavage/methylation domain-containing protein [Planctomycetota bacterium]
MEKRKTRKLYARMSHRCHSREGGNPVLHCWIPGQARNDKTSGFTLVEIILVVLILSIAALVAIPMFVSAADVQVRSAANRIAADLDYARGLAITRQKNYTVVFVPDNASTSTVNESSYDIREAGGTASNIIKNPLDNRNFTVSLAADNRVSSVNILSVNFDAVASNAITFDYLGTPYPGNVASPTVRLNSQGVVTLKSRVGAFTVSVKVEPLTGSVTIE